MIVSPRGSVKVLGGTVILEPGLVEDDFREMAREGVRAVKFIQAIPDRAEAVRFSKWAKQNGMRVMIHCGGTSLPGVPTTTAAGIVEVQPDVLAHLNGGCIALSNSDIDQLTRNTGWTIDLVRFPTRRRWRGSRAWCASWEHIGESFWAPTRRPAMVSNLSACFLMGMSSSARAKSRFRPAGPLV